MPGGTPMRNLHVAALATLFGISAASGIALTQAPLIAAADQDDRGNGHNNNNRNNGNWQNNQNGQCNTNGNTRRGDGDADDQGSQRNQGSRGAGHGKKRGWQNPNNPHFCGYTGNCNNNGQYN